MADPIITLTTDFGPASPYVAAMKGVILGINPAARILDLSHSIPPQDLRYAAFFLQHAIASFPPEVIHVVVVDPGVGTKRALLYVGLPKHQLLVPDNGCWTPLAGAEPEVLTVIRLTEPSFWRHPVLATFHGRDILAPAAAHLSRGLDPCKLGVPASHWVRLQIAAAGRSCDGLHGEVIFIDDFGNVITNLPAELLERLPARGRTVQVGMAKVQPTWVQTYGQAAAGTLVGLISSAGTLEIAVVQGSAARQLHATLGDSIRVTGQP